MERLPGCKGCSGVCHICDKHVDDIFGCECDEPLLKEDIPMSAEYNEDGTIKLPDAGASEPVNDPGAFEQLADEAQPEAPPVDETVVGEEGEQDIDYAVHIIMMADGNFAIQATNSPNLGEMQMIVSRTLESIVARMHAETVVAMLQKQPGKESRIITPGR